MPSPVAAAVAFLPPKLRRFATPARVLLLEQFISFGLVGFAGLAVDLCCVYGLRPYTNLYVAGLASYLVSVSVTYALNRALTFRAHVSRVSVWRQWVSFLAANVAGFVLNRGTYAVLIASFERAAAQPAIAVCAGAVAGMFVNFTLSRRLVFR